jgi:superfamily II DNA or RNA helicase
MSSPADLNRVLTPKGYAVKKSHLTDKQAAELRKTLTVAPKVLDKFQWTVTRFPIYSESKTRFYVPRHWGIKTYGEPEASILPAGLPLPSRITWNASFAPHDFQQEIMSQFVERGANGLICVPCGYGKTFMALRIALTLGLRFLIIVDKEFLMNQWKAEMERFLHGIRIGVLQAEKVQTDAAAYDVTIGMIQTICRRDFPDGFFDQYGFTIFDECHHLGASYFCRALQRIQTRYMLGLSATPDREDGLTFVFESFLGEPVYKKTQRDPDREAKVRAVWFTSEDPAYAEIPLNPRGEPITAKLLNQVAEYEPRNQRILSLIHDYAGDNRRFLLLLSDRISQLDWFHERLTAHPSCSGFKVGYYIGGMKQTVLDENADTCRLLLATYQMASEAFSVKRLNTVILATPRKNVQQSTGRVFRERMEERKVPPHIVDIIDSHDCHKRRWYVRQKFYKECEYTMEHIGRPGRNGKVPSPESLPAEEDEEKEMPKEESCLIRF